jgi:hypothetical protein
MTFDNQVDLLYHILRQGVKVNRVIAFQRWGIADLRSRISDVAREYKLIPDRQRVKGKKYLEYFVKK